jgi:transcriptional regulator with XRE-family HTH domain
MIQMDLMDIAKKIKDLRKEKGWSQADLGKKVGVHQRYVSTWETGQNIPQAETLIRLSQVLEVSVDYLLFNNVPRDGYSKISDFELYEQFRQADSLPDEEKKAIKKLVGAVVFQHKVKLAQEEAAEEEQKKQQQLQQVRRAKQASATPLRKVAGKR